MPKSWNQCGPDCASHFPGAACTCGVNEGRVKPNRPLFTRRTRNQPLTVSYEIYHPGKEGAGIRSYSETVTVQVESGDAGGERGEFVAWMQERLMEWFDGAVVSVK